jgi:hypothetical protein
VAHDAFGKWAFSQGCHCHGSNVHGGAILRVGPAGPVCPLGLVITWLKCILDRLIRTTSQLYLHIMSNLESEWSFCISTMITYRSQRRYSNSRCIPTLRPQLQHRTDEPSLSPQFTAKSLNRQAKKAQKDENAEKARLKKVREPSSFRLL